MGSRNQRRRKIRNRVCEGGERLAPGLRETSYALGGDRLGALGIARGRISANTMISLIIMITVFMVINNKSESSRD